MKMATAVPPGPQNGLNDLMGMLVDRPDNPLICVVVLDSSQTLIDHIKHQRTPTIRVKHIEPMLREDEQDRALGLLTDAYKRRTSEQLEFDYEFEPIRRDAPEFYPSVT